uniref:Chlorophyll a-b binding protein, chloroplastic n=1 Tax=Mesostigma viride TaxID=41882 RepID=A2SY25_MESVI|nr:light-harvesting chlorophyll-a/b binding protein Lhcb5 [Mesostigma viride]
MASTMVSSFMGTQLKQAVVASTQVSKVQVTEALFGKKKGTAKATPKKAAAPADGAAKWYGPDRPKYLPTGLLDPADIPAYMNGELAGDYGYDPLGLGNKGGVEKYRPYEVLHGRWAMLGVVGMLVPEGLYANGNTNIKGAVWWDSGAVLLDPSATLTWAGIPNPVPLALAVIFEVAVFFLIENYRYQQDGPWGTGLDPLYPGGKYFDPLGLASDPSKADELKVKEIKNGRLAMMAFLGFVVQYFVTKEGPYANWSKHLADPFGYNFLTILGSGSERVPTL